MTSERQSPSFRMLAPAAGASSLKSIVPLIKELRQTGAAALEERLLGELKKLLAGEVRLAGSGREALANCLAAAAAANDISRIFISAYTCPDVVSAAVTAGLLVNLVDVDPRTLDPVIQQEPETRSLLLLSNLYGLPDRVSEDTAARLVIVDDACQSVLTAAAGTRAGTRFGGYGVVSFGRGKALSAAGGGACCTPAVLPQNKSGKVSCKDELSSFAYLAALKTFEHPRLYPLPANLPFLGLGETHYRPSFAKRLMTRSEQIAALASLNTMHERAAVYVERAKSWHEQLEGSVVEPFVEKQLPFDGSAVPIRYPIIFPSIEQRDRAYRLLLSFGASMSYRRTLNELCRGDERVQPRNCPGAEQVAQTLLTLPVHSYVTERDISHCCAIVKRITARS